MARVYTEVHSASEKESGRGYASFAAMMDGMSAVRIVTPVNWREITSEKQLVISPLMWQIMVAIVGTGPQLQNVSKDIAPLR